MKRYTIFFVQLMLMTLLIIGSGFFLFAEIVETVDVEGRIFSNEANSKNMVIISQADLEQLAAASAQRAEAVRQGIRLLAARGDVQIVQEGDTTIQLAPGDGVANTDGGATIELEHIPARLRALLQETAAYRVYFGRAAPERLV